MDETRWALLEVKLTELHKAVVGNGKPGLIDEWQEHKVTHAKIEGGVNLIRWLVGIIGLPTIGSVIWLVFKTWGMNAK